MCTITEREKKMVNKIILQGRLVADAELRIVGDGISTTEFTVAWSETYKDTERKLFLRCKAWRGTAEFITNYFKKGQQIIIEGNMQTEEWTKDGEKKSRTVCNVEKASFCGGKSENAVSGTGEKLPNGDEFMNIPDDMEELPF